MSELLSAKPAASRRGLRLANYVHVREVIGLSVGPQAGLCYDARFDPAARSGVIELWLGIVP
jgi:hypothetical protein